MPSEQSQTVTDSRQDVVGAEQVRIVYEHIKPGILASLVNALLLTYIQFNVVDHLVLFGWLGYLFLVNLVRYVFVNAYQRTSPAVSDSERWKRIFIIGTGFAGSAWGLAAILLMPVGHPLQQVITMLVLAGTVAGATATQSALLASFKAFSLLSLLPLFFHLLYLGGLTHYVLAALTAIFIVFMLGSARRNSENLLTSLNLNYDNQQLLENLAREKQQVEGLNENLKQEIAQRLTAEMSLRRKEVSLEEAQRIAGLGSWEWDLDTDRVSLSVQMRNLFGLNPAVSNYAYRACLQGIVEEDRQKVDDTRRKALASMTSYKVEYRVGRGDGHPIVLEEQGVPRTDHTNQVQGLAAIALDITQRKEMDRIKNDFISVVSHELRTPLTSISGTLGLIKGGVTGELNDRTRDMINVAERNAMRLSHLVNDILDIDKLEFGGLPLESKPLDLIDIIRDAIEENLAYAEQLGVALTLGEHPDSLVLYGDRERLVQVLTNLLSNAAKYSPGGESVEVSVNETEHWVRVAVRDRGPGIAEAFREQVFNKFCQGDTTDARYQYGTGLGLNIAKVIVERHGGEIGFDSTLGQGTTFWFTLPCAKD
ncbi:MAG: PAS domain-containing protein [Gammaproteobacteria bacterium]|nr:PAS domain-containing protein [Gammaproteobacteria bacterium]